MPRDAEALKDDDPLLPRDGGKGGHGTRGACADDRHVPHLRRLDHSMTIADRPSAVDDLR
jgi:hypothetical protein